jgi:hypothetical protein
MTESDLQITLAELFSLEDEFDGLRTTTRLEVGEAAQSIQAHPENGVCTADIECRDNQSTLLTTNGSENLPSDLDDTGNPSSQVVPPPSPPNRQPTLSQLVTAHPTFTFSFPSSSSTQPVGQKGGRCSVCTKALCPRRHECNGSVNRAWCRHGHSPLGANEKVRWLEAEVERRIAAKAGST